jgi:hypothetical protein
LKTPPPAPPTVVAPVGASDAVPAFLPITVQLTTPITDKDTVGRLIEGRVAGEVRHKGKIVIRVAR